MKNIILLLSLMHIWGLAQAEFTYRNTPASTANPPQDFAQDPNVPITPNPYGPNTPLIKTSPPGTRILQATPPDDHEGFHPPTFKTP